MVARIDDAHMHGQAVMAAAAAAVGVVQATGSAELAVEAVRQAMSLAMKSGDVGPQIFNLAQLDAATVAPEAWDGQQIEADDQVDDSGAGYGTGDELHDLASLRSDVDSVAGAAFYNELHLDPKHVAPVVMGGEGLQDDEGVVDNSALTGDECTQQGDYKDVLYDDLSDGGGNLQTAEPLMSGEGLGNDKGVVDAGLQLIRSGGVRDASETVVAEAGQGDSMESGKSDPQRDELPAKATMQAGGDVSQWELPRPPERSVEHTVMEILGEEELASRVAMGLSLESWAALAGVCRSSVAARRIAPGPESTSKADSRSRRRHRTVRRQLSDASTMASEAELPRPPEDSVAEVASRYAREREGTLEGMAGNASTCSKVMKDVKLADATALVGQQLVNVFATGGDEAESLAAEIIGELEVYLKTCLRVAEADAVVAKFRLLVEKLASVRAGCDG